ncbi:hypothetical protein [Microseira sp. BLCC-F43]|uniref:hypothetical protein n=1 Tax=Microseira sp. BLCC-F43 TaxID=3153602 RepID=UPI0035B9006E
MTKSEDSNFNNAIANLSFPVANFFQEFDAKTLPISLVAGLPLGIIGVLFDTFLAAVFRRFDKSLRELALFCRARWQFAL